MTACPRCESPFHGLPCPREVPANSDLVERLAHELTHQRGYRWETLGVYGQIHWRDEARKVLALPTVTAALRRLEKLT